MRKYDLLALFLIVTLGLILRFYVLNFLPFSINLNLVYGIGNIFLLWLIGMKIFNRKIALFASFLYSISPWTIYLEIAGAKYILLLFFLLLLFFGIIVKKNTIFYRALILIPFFYVLYFTFFLNGGVANDITIFKDVGLINAVNDFRGEASQTAFKSIDKFIENKYIYLTQHFIYHILKNLTPLTYFTPEFKLLNFSFSPPIFVGFIVPFIFGISFLFDLIKKNKLYLLLLLLILPSVLSKNSPDLSKLIIFSPVIFYTISHGLEKLMILSKKRLFKVILFFVIFIVALQLITTLSDISTREVLRYQKSEVRI